MINDYFITFNKESICAAFMWHSLNFLFGIITGLVIGNTKFPCIQLLHNIGNSEI